MRAKLDNVQESQPDALAGFGFNTAQRAELILSEVDGESQAVLDRLVHLDLAEKNGSTYRIKLRRKTVFS